MKIARSLRVVAAVAAVGLLASACGNSLDEEPSSGGASPAAPSAAPSAAGSSAPAATETIKVGFVSPLTGPLAGFGPAGHLALLLSKTAPALAVFAGRSHFTFFPRRLS